MAHRLIVVPSCRAAAFVRLSFIRRSSRDTARTRRRGVCFVEAEESWARPPRASDLAGDDRERVPGSVPPHEAVLDNHHLMCLAAPGAHQSRAWFQLDLAYSAPIR